MWKGPKTIDLTGGMALLGHSLPSTKNLVWSQFSLLILPFLTKAIDNITVNKLSLNNRGLRVSNGISKSSNIRRWCCESFVHVHVWVRISTIAFGNPTKGIVADNHKIFRVFCSRKLIVKIFKCTYKKLSLYWTRFNFLSRLHSFMMNEWKVETLKQSTCEFFMIPATSKLHIILTITKARFIRKFRIHKYLVKVK